MQLHDDRISLMKETVVLSGYAIDYRTYVGDHGETTIGQYFWDEQYSVVNYREVCRIQGKALDFSNLAAAEQKLKLLLTFS